MYGIENAGEKLKNPEAEKRGDYADVWENAGMEDAPAFAGEDLYGTGDEAGVATETVTETQVEKPAENEKTAEAKYGGAEKLTSYGLDTASKMYGLENVLKAVAETDETGRDVNNPIGSIYERLVPNPDERKNLYHEIQKDTMPTADEENPDGASRDMLGMIPSGEVYARDNMNSSDALDVKEANEAIRQMKKLLDALENDMRFEDVRKRAAEQGKDIITFLTEGEINPTLSNFFDGLDAASGGTVDEILDEIEEEEKAKQAEEANLDSVQ